MPTQATIATRRAWSRTARRTIDDGAHRQSPTAARTSRWTAARRHRFLWRLAPSLSHSCHRSGNTQPTTEVGNRHEPTSTDHAPTRDPTRTQTVPHRFHPDPGDLRRLCAWDHPGAVRIETLDHASNVWWRARGLDRPLKMRFGYRAKRTPRNAPAPSAHLYANEGVSSDLTPYELFTDPEQLCCLDRRNRLILHTPTKDPRVAHP